MFEVFHFIKIYCANGPERVIFAGKLGSKFGTWEIDTRLVDPAFISCRETCGAAADAGHAMWGHYAPTNRAEAMSDLWARHVGIIRRVHG